MIRMGKSAKNRETTNEPEIMEPTPTPTPAVSVRTEPQNTAAVSESEMMARDIKEGRLSGFVGGGTVLTGETTFESMLRIDGHIKGRVSSDDGTLIIGSTGQVDADISVASAIINGTVNGDVVTYEKLTLGRTAQVVGNIQAPSLIIEDGATLEGSCSMLQSKEEVAARIEESRQEQVAEQQRLAAEQELEQESFETTNEVTDTVEDSSETDTPEYGSISESEMDSDDEDEIEENADAATI